MKEADIPNKQDKLKELKEYVTYGYDYFKDNYITFNNNIRKTYVTNISESQRRVLIGLDKPDIEANMSQHFLSRILSIVYKNNPSLRAYHSEIDNPSSDLISFFEGHGNAILHDSYKDMWQNSIIKDCLSGGMGVGEVCVVNKDDNPFFRMLKLKRIEPSLAGFDPMAVLPNKSDGRFYYKIYVKTEKQIKKEFSRINIDEIQASPSDFKGFKWSYKGQTEKIIRCIEFFLKEEIKEKVVLLSNYSTFTQKEYEEILKVFEQVKILGLPRDYLGNINENILPESLKRRAKVKNLFKEYIEKGMFPTQIDEASAIKNEIHKYNFLESTIIDHVVTDYSYLPGVFFDGNSVTCAEEGENLDNVSQHIAAYLKNTDGVQQLVNSAIQSWANELDLSVPAKFMLEENSFPTPRPGIVDPFRYPQASVLYIYKGFKNNDPNIRLPAPIIMNRPELPRHIIEALSMAPSLMQNILGAYDSVVRDDSAIISGKALEKSMINADSAAKPFYTGYFNGLDQVATIMSDMIPKIYKIPLKYPVFNNAEHSSTYFDIEKYDPDELKMRLKLEAAGSSEAEKENALTQLRNANSSFPIVAKFLDNEDNLVPILKNLDIQGKETFLENANAFVTNEKTEKQNPPPEDAESKYVDNEFEVQKEENMIRAKKVQDEYEINTKKIEIDKLKLALENDKNETNKAKIAAELAIKTDDLNKTHHLKNLEIADKIIGKTKK